MTNYREKAKKLEEALKKCCENCVCQTESELFIDEAKEVLSEWEKLK